MKEEYKYIGKKVQFVDAPLKVTGGAKYVGDIVLPGMLHGKILRSKFAHARILNIDASKAERLPGVRAVITGKNTPMVRYGDNIGMLPERVDEYPLATEKVRYVGDEVAAVAAIDEDIAEEALDLIEVEYEELPAVFTSEEAMKPDALLVHDNADRNIAHQVLHNFGDVEKGFGESDYIREDRFVTHHVNHAFIETVQCLADFKPTGELVMWATTQAPFFVHEMLSWVLKIPKSKIRVIKPYVGGGFGGKLDLTALYPCSALLSKITGRPVKIAYSRMEQFLVARHRHAITLELKTGVKRDGTLVAKQCRCFYDGGAYASWGPAILANAAGFFNILFRIPNVRFEGYRIYTNKPPCGAMRSFDNVTLRFADDSHMDMVARDLSLDTADFYLKNVSRGGDITPSKYKLTSCGTFECIKEVTKASNWREKRGKLSGNRGIGIALGDHTAGGKIGPVDATGALLKVLEDGTVSLFMGTSDAGQGSNTLWVMVVAEELGIPLEDVRITVGDTEVCPPDMGAYGSRTTFPAGNAVRMAALDAIKQIFEVVSDNLECSPEDLEAKNGRIYVKGTPERGITFKEAVAACQTSDKIKILPIVGKGYYDPPDTVALNMRTGEGHWSAAYGFGAQVAEVEVDPETGQVKILEVISANDPGKVLNLLSLEGQSAGGIVMSLGQTLYEEVLFDKKGRAINSSFLNYKIPTTLNIPQIKSIWVEPEDPDGPYGGKGIGECVLVSTPAAIANAIYDAVGVRIKELPITPEKILKALEKKVGKSQ